QSASYTRKIPAVSYFFGSVSGLGPGSPVTMHGLTVGHVLDVRLAHDKTTHRIVAPVRYEVELERLVGIGVEGFKTGQQSVDTLLKQGLRATLQSASLITGQQQIALDIVPEAPQVDVTMQDGDFVLPSADDDGFAGLQASANDFLKKVNSIPVDKISQNLDEVLNSINELASGPSMREALTHLPQFGCSTH